MILTLKNLQQQTLTVDVDPNDTVAVVKSKIEQKEKQPASWQKLIFSGKVLDDNQTIASYGIKESDFLVLMVRKPAGAAATPAPAAASPAKPAETPKPVETKPAETTPAPAATTPAPAATTTAAPAPAADSSLVTGTAYESTVNQLIEMGFPREDVVKALRAAFNNPDRAVEYLMSGIPNIPEVAASPARSPAPASTAAPTATPTATGQPSLSPTTPLIPPQFMGQQPAAPSGGGVFDFLRQHPQFNTLRMMVQQNPELLQPVLQQLGQANPSILQLINQHQQEFIQLLNEPVAPGSSPAPGPGGLGTPPSGAQYIQVTPEEKAAIERLEKMGFDRAQVVEAFFACDKDEQLAANYLLEHQFEDFDDDDQTNQ